LGRIDSHLPMTIFCWLPPDRLPTVLRQLGVLDLQLVAVLIEDRNLRAVGHERPGRQVIDLRQGHVVPAIHAKHEALFLAAFGHQRDALCDGVDAGEEIVTSFAVQQDLPGGRLAQAEQVSAISVRPAPTRP
jgi:hypothetical protein